MLNHIIIMGRLTRDPELRRTGSGLAVASFSVAVERDYPNKETGEKDVDFVNCVAWRQAGEFVSKYFSKGSMIVVSGRLQMKKWVDKDGNKRTDYEVVAENVYFGGSKKENTATGTPIPTTGFGSWEPPTSDFSMFGEGPDDGAMLPF